MKLDIQDNRPKKAASCGTWVSPLTAEDVTGSTVGLHDLSVDGDTLYWLESRPSENGRSALVRKLADGTIEDVTPVPVNVASRVHEYGGGAYHAEGGKIVYSEKSDNSVWLIEDGGEPRRITGIEGCRYADFRFVPETGNIVCVREDHRDRPPTDPEAAIVILDASAAADPETNEGSILTRGPDFLSSPRISPDGNSIAWLSWEHPDMPWDATQLHVARLLGNVLEQERIVAGAEQREAIVQPEWSPNGDLYFCTDRTGWWNIYRIGVDGTTEAVTTVPDGEIGGPHWVFGDRYYDFLPDGGIIAALSQDGKTRAVTVKGGAIHDLGLPPVAECPAILPGSKGRYDLAYLACPPDAMPSIKLVAAGHDDEKAQVLRTAGPDLLEKPYVSVGREITFPTADGDEAHAFYYPPVNGDYQPMDGEKPPLIVMGHGGPTSCAGTGFSSRIQWWTTRGFAVADVNYRGSTGFGRSYRQKLDGQWGVVDVEDCVHVVKYLAEQGLADADRAAIRGGSAGGFTVLAALTTSDVFKAGASLYGIGDLMLLAEETHKFESRYPDRLVGPLPESEAVYRERSPINHLDKMSAGVIFFQGLDDKVVPPSQATTMVEAMRERGMPVAHIEFEGEGHGFRKAENQRRVLELELGFYGRMFGFEPPGLSEKVEIEGLEKTEMPGKSAAGGPGTPAL